MADETLIHIREKVRQRREKEQRRLGNDEDHKVDPFILKCLNSNEDGDAALFKVSHKDRFVYEGE